MPKKKVKLKKRFYNIWTHLRNPLPLFLASLGMGLIITMFVLAFPCGKYSHPVQGVCSNGNPFMNPLHWFIGGTFVTLLFELIQSSGFENDIKFKQGKVSIVQSIFGYFQQWPKWRKKWFPIFFIFAYILFAAFFILDIYEGIRWYNYVGQFGVVVPFMVSFSAFSFANWARKKLKIK